MTAPSPKVISAILIAIFFNILLSTSPVRGEAVTSVLGAQAANYTCGEIKDIAQKAPERLFKMWANSGTIETHSAAAVQIIKAGNVQWLLENIGDVLLGIQILEEAAFGTVENSAKILSKALVTKSFTAVMDMVGKGGAYGPAAAIIFTCETLYAFADALTAESVDINTRNIAAAVVGENPRTGKDTNNPNPRLLELDYFIKNQLGWDGQKFKKYNYNEGPGIREMAARRGNIVEYAARKLNIKITPKNDTIDEWHINSIRTVVNILLKDAKALVEKKRKFKQLQDELKTKLAALKQQHAALTTFQAIRRQLQAMTCQDTASPDCIDAYNLSLSMLGDLMLDAGDIKGLAVGTLDGLKASSKSLDGKLDAIGPILENEYKTKVAEYCKNAKAGIDSLKKTISLAKMSNPEIAARATQAKGYRDKACSSSVLSEAKAAADSAKNAATEAHLLSNLVPLLPSDINNLSPPEVMDILSLEAELASMEQALTSYEKTVSENFKKWEKFRASVNNVRNQLSKVRSACGKEDIINGVAIDFLIGRIEGKLKSIESTVPDVRAEKNALGTLSRALKQNSTYLKKLKGNHEKYRECLKKVPDTKTLVDEAKKLLQEAKDNVGKSERYASEAAGCYNELKNKLQCDADSDCPDDQTCKDGQCVDKPKPKCASDSDCPVDYICKDGDCVDQPKPKCASDSDCPDDQTCKDGQCVDKPKPKCASDSDCPVDYVCKDGDCVYQPKPKCASDSDCPVDYICKDGDCVYQPKPKCASDSDCPVDYICKDGDCVYQPKPKCASDSDCPVDYVCKDGDCVYQKPTGCQSDGDCAKGYVCDQGSGKCISPFDPNYGSFTQAQTTRDDQRSQNLADQNINDQNTGQSGYSSDDLAQNISDVQDQVSKDCYNNSDCPSGFHCEGGKCVKNPGCKTPSDCPANHVCENGTCVPKKPVAQTPAQPATQPPPQPPPVQTANASLGISPANKVITKSESVTFKAILNKGDGTTEDVTAKASWSPSQNFSSKNIGTHTVKVTFDKLSASASVSVVEEKGLGDITVSEKTITVTFWDHGTEDGDMIDININGKAVFSGITLTKAPQSRTINLKAGALVFGFTALNEGRLSPNTATVKFTSVVAGKAEQKYSLKKNAKANMNVTYTPK